MSFSNILTITLTVATASLLSLPAAQARELSRNIDRRGNIVDFEPHSVQSFATSTPGWELLPHPSGQPGQYIAKKKLRDGSVLYSYGIWRSDELLLVHDESLYRDGLMNKAGALVVKPQYRSISQFSAGYGLAQRLDKRSEIIDVSGKVQSVLPADIHATSLAPLSSNVIGVRRNSDQKFGLYNFHTQTFHPCGECNFEFSEGLGLVRDNGREGFVDENGTFVVPPQYRCCAPFSDGLAKCIKNAYDVSYIDKTGKTVLKLGPEAQEAGSFSEGLAAVAVGGNMNAFRDTGRGVGAKLQFIDKSGKVVIPAFATNGNDQNMPVFSEGLVPVMDTKGKWGYMDHCGRWAIRPMYDWAYNFKDGLAFVIFGKDGFSKLDWKICEQHHYSRDIEFLDFVSKFKLIGLQRERIHHFLGAPIRQAPDRDEYLLSFDPDERERRCVEIHYASGVADKYRITKTPLPNAKRT